MKTPGRRAITIYLLFLACLLPITAFSQAPETGPNVPGQEALPDLPELHGNYNPFLFSEGYVLGHVHKNSVEGTIVKKFEGEVLLGLSSTPGGVVEDECVESKIREMQAQQTPNQPQSSADLGRLREQAIDQCMIRINPFSISSYSTDWQKQLNQFLAPGDLSLIRYEGYWFHPLLDSPYFVQQVIPVKDYALPMRSLDEIDRFPIYRNLHYGTSQADGRVVIASVDGIVRKHFHVILQSGAGGGHFEHIDVPTASLYDFIVSCMATGRPVRIYYFVLFGPQAAPSNLLKGYGTNLRAYRVDVLDK